MTALDATVQCCLCTRPATVSLEPPRRTLARGVDPSDTDYSVTVILPDVQLCAEHGREVLKGAVAIGWCDDERCRGYGEVGELSDCRAPFEKLGRGHRS